MATDGGAPSPAGRGHAGLPSVLGWRRRGGVDCRPIDRGVESLVGSNHHAEHSMRLSGVRRASTAGPRVEDDGSAFGRVWASGTGWYRRHLRRLARRVGGSSPRGGEAEGLAGASKHSEARRRITVAAGADREGRGLDGEEADARAEAGGRRRLGSEMRTGAPMVSSRPAFMSVLSVSRGDGFEPSARGATDAATHLDASLRRATVLRLTAGVLSTMVVRSLLAPFERVKLEYMLNQSKLPLVPLTRNIFAAEGARGFWKGNYVNLLRVCPYKAINFAAFDFYRGVAARASPGGAKDVDNALLALAGAAAGITSVTLCFPMDVVRTRLLVTGGMRKYGGILACFSTLYAKQGIGAFYQGFMPAIMSMAPNGAVYYTVYDWLKMNRLRQLGAEAAERESLSSKSRGERRGSGDDGDGGEVASSAPVRVEQAYMMLYGATAGVASEFSTFPFEVVRRRMQLQGGGGSASNVVGRKAIMRMAATLRAILKRRGLSGLYTGCVPSCLQVVPSAALGYYSYEMFKLLLGVD